MKISIYLLCLVILPFGTKLVAQSGDGNRERVVFGAKAGLNYSNAWDRQGENFNSDAKAGFAGGVFLGIPIGKFLGVQPELLISQEGFKGEGTLFGSEYSFKRTTTYLNVPLQFQLKPVEFLAIVAGPQYSFLLNERNNYNFGSTGILQEQEFDNENIRKNNLGFVGGADIIISHLVISGRLGCDFLHNNGDGTSSTPKYKNRWIQLTVGFIF